MKENSPRQPGRSAELPPLEQLTLEQSTTKRKALLVLRLLRETARQYQSYELQRFYSIRAVAARFGLSSATVSRVYERLRSEGLLRLIWGSQTLLEPIESARERRPQSIAVAVELSRFSSSPEYRAAILGVQRELWSHRVAERLIFFEQSPEELLHLCKHYHVEAVDTLIWAFPQKVTRQLLSKLSALGLRVICIAPYVISGTCECYVPSPGATISKLVRDKVLRVSGPLWGRRGLDGLRVPRTRA
jgi:DNA-binding transcriptional ArsR family regulator